MLKLVINNNTCIEEFVHHKCAAQWHFTSTQIKKYLQSAGRSNLYSHQQSRVPLHPCPHWVLCKCYLNSRKGC